MEHATGTAIAPPPTTIEMPANSSTMTASNPANFSAAVTSEMAPPASSTTLGETAHASSPSPDVEIVIPRFTPRIREALQLLADAAACAQDVGADIWQFSVELSALRRAGLTANECRWLVAKGLARHAREVTASDSDRRIFQNYANLAFSKRTCFVIAERGVLYANALLRSMPRRRASDVRDSTALNRRRPAPESNGDPAMLTPTWDSDRQQLRVGRVIVKEFKVPAANQEAILAAFQEEGWVPRIDDPLPPQLNQDSKRRLHDTINSLNRNQKHALLRFLGDGRGEGIRWEFASDPPSDEPRAK
jgi:hypothetical protein